MPPNFKDFLQRWVIGTVAVLVATKVVDGISYDRWHDLLVATLLLGILNSFVRPVLLVLSLPFLIFTLGLFTLVINAILLMLVDLLLRPHFRVPTFWDAFWGALIISIITVILNAVTGKSRMRVEVKRGRRRPPKDREDPPQGPVIDV